MPTFDALLHDVLDHPDDDVPRLILGDYLLDQPDAGSHARGEFIHTQCRLAELPMDHPDRPALEVREAQLHAEYPQRWARPFRRRGAKAWAFGRGLVEELSLRPEQFDRVSEVMWRAQPVQRLRLLPGSSASESSGEWASRFQKWPDIGRITALDCGYFPAGSSLLNSHRLAGLRELTFAQVLGPVSLTSAPWLGTLEALNAVGWSAATEHLSPILHPQRMPLLRSLHIRSLDGLEPLVPQLRHLHLYHAPLRSAAIVLGKESPLESFAVTGSADWASLTHLLQSRAVEAIHTLHLCDVELNDTGVITNLLGRRLVRLTLANCINGLHLEVLARGGNLERLRHLSVTNTPSRRMVVTASAMKALTEADLRSLLSLNLSDCRMELNAFLDMLNAPWLEQLHTLELGTCGLRTHALSVIAHRGPWPRLARLDLRGNAMTADDRTMLRQRFGVRVRY